MPQAQPQQLSNQCYRVVVNSRFRAVHEYASVRLESHRSTAKSELREGHRLRDETREMDFEFHRDLAYHVKEYRRMFTKNRDRT